MDQEQQDTARPSPNRRRRLWIALGAGAVAVAAVVAGLGMASAQTTTTPTSTTVPDRHEKLPGGFHGGPKGFGGPGIHGEFTTRGPNGGYQTLANQVGEVTAVDDHSITVKSEDGFSRTYGVDENTLVNAGRDGIGSVKTGETVHVTALVNDGKATAVDIVDSTSVGRLRQRWHPRRPAPPDAPPNA